MDCSLPDHSVHGIFQERVPEWVAIAFSSQLQSDSQLRNTFSYIYWFIVKGYGWGYKWTSSWKRCINSVQSLSRVWLCVTPWTVARQASLSITNSRSLLKLMSMESVMPSNHFILCCLLLLPLVFPSIRVFSSGSVLCIRWPQYWSFSISPSMNIQNWFPLGLYMGKDTELPCPNPILLGFFWRFYYICVIDWITGQWWSTSNLSPLPGLEGWDWNLMLTKIDWKFQPSSHWIGSPGNQTS